MIEQRDREMNWELSMNVIVFSPLYRHEYALL